MKRSLLAVLAALVLGLAGAQQVPPRPTLAELQASTIPALQARKVPGSAFKLLSEASRGASFRRFVVAYDSDGLRVNGLLAVPDGKAPAGGWPAILFLHGYVPPKVYSTTGRYFDYVNALAAAGFVVFKPDYRGHAQSQGIPQGAYWSPAYTIDTMNALASLRRDARVNPGRVGVWGHSMGGFLGLRALVLDHTLRAGVLWGGVVGTAADILTRWHAPSDYTAVNPDWKQRRQELLKAAGTPDSNPKLYAALSAPNYLAGLPPVQLHHAVTDPEVPLWMSTELRARLKKLGREVSLYEYPNDDHNISRNFSAAMNRTIAFFKDKLAAKP
ncbi:MAG TPA: alpha/beta fold hydrolase [Deinococcales bacterium]|nr:alpha/beta fold hydrolase [Deinococcales bacterium]